MKYTNKLSTKQTKQGFAQTLIPAKKKKKKAIL